MEEVEKVKEGKVKKEVEAQAVSEKVEVTGMVWLRAFLGGQSVGHDGHAPGPGTPLSWQPPPFCPSESSIWTLCFVMH